MQKFLEHWGGASTLDFLVENILRNLRPMIHHPYGTFVVQAVVKCRSDQKHISLLIRWIVANMKWVYRDKPAVHGLRCVLYILSEKVKEGIVNKWSELLDLVVAAFVGTVHHGRPLLIEAACHKEGYLVVSYLIKVNRKLGKDMRKKLLEIMMTYRNSLMADEFGCFVLKGLQGAV